jgi:hypothetical protein
LNRCAALEEDNVDINRAWENITESIKISAKERLSHYQLKQHRIAVVAEPKLNE